MEEEVTRSGEVTIHWQPSYAPASRSALPAGGGVYVIERNGSPIYVGLATRYASRLPSHRTCIERFFGPAERGQFLIRIGRILPRPGTDSKAYEGDLRLAEHALIRLLISRGRRLHNRTTTTRFRIPDHEYVRVHFTGAHKPPYLQRGFEWGPGGLSREF